MVESFVFIRTEPGRDGNVVRNLKEIEEVKAVHQTPGPYNVIVQSEPTDLTSVSELVINRIRGIEGVVRTYTSFSVE